VRKVLTKAAEMSLAKLLTFRLLGRPHFIIKPKKLMFKRKRFIKASNEKMKITGGSRKLIPQNREGLQNKRATL
jgi:hypothetical protein